MGFTVTVTVAVSEQPSEPPTTVYVLVLAGLTVNIFPAGPPSHAKLVAPLAVRETLLPAQIAGVAGVTVTFGIGLTVTVTVAVETQPWAEVTATVYVVVTAGETETMAVKSPVFQL